MRFVICLFMALLCSCGSGSSGSGSTADTAAASVSAPASLSGLGYLGTVTDGSGAFAETGTFTIDFNTASDYVITGDGTDTIDSSGTYTYSTSGATGTVLLNDGTLGSFSITLVFTARDMGTYSADAGGGNEQNGTFAAASTILAPMVVN